MMEEIAPESGQMRMLLGFRSGWRSRPIERALTILRQQVRSQFEVFVQELDMIIGMLFSWKKSIMWKVKPLNQLMLGSI